MVIILDGKKVQSEIAQALRRTVEAFSPRPRLAIVQVGAREESTAYIERKKIFGSGIGVAVEHVGLPEFATEEEIAARIRSLSSDSRVTGVILQLPLPAHLARQRLLDAMDPRKDVDGLTSANVAARAEGNEDASIPATARGVVELLEWYRIPLRGRKAAVLGRSSLVGAPTADFLSRKGADVTVCHSQTENTKEITRASDIIIVAIGKPKLIGADYVRSDQTQIVVDVGLTAVRAGDLVRLEEELPRKQLVGDVDFEAVKDKVAAISPVPGGVGPMTVLALFENLVDAYEKQR